MLALGLGLCLLLGEKTRPFSVFECSQIPSCPREWGHYLCSMRQEVEVCASLASPLLEVSKGECSRRWADVQYYLLGYSFLTPHATTRCHFNCDCISYGYNAEEGVCAQCSDTTTSPLLIVTPLPLAPVTKVGFLIFFLIQFLCLYLSIFLHSSRTGGSGMPCTRVHWKQW